MNGHMSESQLHDYLDGLLPPDMVEAMDAHLAGAPWRGVTDDDVA